MYLDAAPGKDFHRSLTRCGQGKNEKVVVVGDQSVRTDTTLCQSSLEGFSRTLP